MRWRRGGVVVGKSSGLVWVEWDGRGMLVEVLRVVVRGEGEGEAWWVCAWEVLVAL